MRTRLVLSALLAAAATVLFSVGASAGASTGAGAPAGARVFRPVGFQPTGPTPAVVPAASSANLQYMGGSVFTTPAVFVIFWGPEWNTGWTSGGFTSAQARTYITSFLGGVGGSTWFNSTKQYCQGIATGSQFCPSGAAHVTNPTGQLKGSFVDTTSVPSRPTDSQVRAAAQRGASHFGYNRNALYMVFTPHNKSISGFGTQFCAYHDNTSFNGQPLAYANMPYAPDAGTACGVNFVNRTNSSFGNGFFDGLSIVSGHEYAEATTDAFPSNTIAWLDTSGQENGDKCAWGRGPGPQSASQDVRPGGHSFAVQSLWSHLANSSTGGCVISSSEGHGARERRARSRARLRRLAAMRLWAALAAVSIVAVLSLGAYAGWNLRDLPRPGDQSAIVRAVDITDRSGQLIAQRSADGQFHIFATLAQMGRYGPPATLAAEDRGFYHHAAVDAPALLRAAATDLVHGGVVEGGSTITQQLVKIELLGPEQTLSRKLQEGFLAYAMERRYSKDEILEMYLNRVYYGHGAYGLASAAQAYFGRDRRPADLSAAQAAFLAGLLQAPNGLDPQRNYDGARGRELYVLAGMRDMGVLTVAEEQQAEQEDVRAELKFDVSYRAARAPHFVEWVMQEAERDLGTAVLQRGGLRIHTTLDLATQSLAERAVAGGVKDLAHLGVNNGAVMAVRPATGEILAWVGSADYADDAIGGQYDLVLARRQPGSSFKPYVYEAALRDRRITLCTTLQDRQTDFGGFSPHDYDNKFLGAMSARRALVLSRNVPAVEVGQLEGMDRVDALARQMGIGTPLGTNLATAIGTAEVTMYDQVQGYAVFADQGQKVPLMGITRIDDASGDPLFVRQPGTQPGQTAVVTPAEAYLVTDVLKDYQRQWGLGWNRQMAAKSGTTGSQTGVHPDAWMMAYSPDLVVGAWAGNTAADGPGAPVAAFGTDVGKTISARFLNGLPRAAAPWYSQPSGLVRGRSGELFLAGTQSAPCGAGATGNGQGGDKEKPKGNGGGGD